LPPQQPGEIYVAPVFRAACYGAGSFVAGDTKGRIWTSERGEFWLPRGYYAKAEEGFRGVAFDGVGRFVAVGSAPASGSALIAVAQADVVPPTPAYTVYNLKDLSNGVFNDEPRSISNSGIIAGSVLLPRGRTAAILRDGSVTAYPELFYGQSSYATSVNDNGIAAAEMLITSVGLSTYTVGASLPDAAQTFPGAGLYSTYSTAQSINSNGLIAGTYYDFNRTQVGIYRYDTSSGDRVDLGNFGLSKINATSINDRGDVAGSYVYELDAAKSNEHLRPFSLSADGQLTLIPTLGGTYIYHVVNSLAGVAGSSSLPFAPIIVNGTHAFLFKDGVTSDIDLFNSRNSAVNGMNNKGDVVGEFSTPNTEVWQHSGGNAFLYRNGAMYDLNRLLDASGDGWVLYRATSINDNGWIVGQGWFHGEHSQPFLAIPAAGKPAGIQTRFVNVSTRLRTGAGDDVLIGGFVIRGGPKRVIVRALGPALSYLGYKLPNILSDPTLELFDEHGQRIAFNDNYTDLPYFPDRNEILGYGLTPGYGGSLCFDSVIAATLSEGNYTAVVRGKNGGAGNCLVELYNVDTDYSPAVVNISTRGPVGTGDDVMIAGFIIRGDRERRVLIRGIGPSLAGSNVPNPLMDPMLEIHDLNGQIAVNDDWRSDQETEIRAAGFAPGDEREAAVILSLWPGNYTAIVRGKGNTGGNALVEVYALP
jgi:probable HAF family extracellular repeat protein